MRALIYRDLYLNKRILLVSMLFVFFMGFNGLSNADDISEMIMTTNMYLSVFVFVLYISVDNISNESASKLWQSFVCVCPIKTRTIVLHKYLLTLITILVGSIVSLVCILYISIKYNMPFDLNQFKGIVISIILILIHNAIYRPLIYRYGHKKAMLFTAISAIFLFLLLITLATLIELGVFGQYYTVEMIFSIVAGYIVLIMLIFSILLFWISSKVSVKLFDKYYRYNL